MFNVHVDVSGIWHVCIEQQINVAFLRAKLNSFSMCSTRQNYFRVKLNLKCNIKERDKNKGNEEKIVQMAPFFPGDQRLGHMCTCQDYRLGQRVVKYETR